MLMYLFFASIDMQAEQTCTRLLAHLEVIRVQCYHKWLVDDEVYKYLTTFFVPAISTTHVNLQSYQPEKAFAWFMIYVYSAERMAGMH